MFSLADCYIDDLGRDYRGYISETKTGKECMMWTEQEPHQHNRTEARYPGTGLGEHNYCRNPDNEPEGAWCYTTDSESRWEYCDLGDQSDICLGAPLGRLFSCNIPYKYDYRDF